MIIKQINNNSSYSDWTSVNKVGQQLDREGKKNNICLRGEQKRKKGKVDIYVTAGQSASKKDK